MIRIHKECIAVGMTIPEKFKLEAVTYVSKSIQRGENVEVVKEIELLLLPGRKVRAMLLLICTDFQSNLLLNFYAFT
ncbi:hypothetical protein P3S68_009969 [Capsicum galapagoense]